MTHRNRRRAEQDDILNLDSLVDVVTNTNGMLLLLAIFTVLLALGKTYQAGFPLARTTEKDPVFFECVGNRIVHISGSEGYSENYEVTTIASGEAITLRSGHEAHSEADLRDPNSSFWRLIARMDPETEYAAFLVRPDSFEVYRTVRDALQEASIDTGWEPFEQEVRIRFTSVGGRIVKPDR